MSLDVGNRERSFDRSQFIQQLASHESNLARWFTHPASEILHHESDCCEQARLWFLSFARSMEIGVMESFSIKAPVWLTKRYTWGPTEWPIAWCQVVEQDVIDCGVFAALARQIFRAQGQACHPAQALLSYNETCTRHWKSLWAPTWDAQTQKSEESFPWIGDKLVYHELCVVETENGDARFYDPTNAIWYEPHVRLGYAALLAVRTECPRLLRWEDKTLICGEWVNL